MKTFPGLFLLLLAAVISGCTVEPAFLQTATPSLLPTVLPVAVLPTFTRTATRLPSTTASVKAVDTATAAATATAAVTATTLPSLTPTVTAIPEQPGCWKPPEDYSRVEVNGWTINRRTLAMLEHAARIYGGELEITGHHITQGSYHDNGAASFGTHLGGGAVDLSVMRKGTYTVLWDDVDPLIYALRVSGFAAWLRNYGELSPDSPIHIHAIAIGDQELSQAAVDQLTGTFGYFRGYTGVPVTGDPVKDGHGGPVLCQWMLNAGYVDLRK